jgi:ASC-1-like (ASCH) protein
MDRDIFDAIRTGIKKVDTRAASPKFINVKTGDILKIVCGKDYFEKIVKKVTIFKTVEDLLESYKVEDINPSMRTAEELKQMYYSFPGYKEKIEQYGLIAMEL